MVVLLASEKLQRPFAEAMASGTPLCGSWRKQLKTYSSRASCCMRLDVEAGADKQAYRRNGASPQEGRLQDYQGASAGAHDHPTAEGTEEHCCGASPPGLTKIDLAILPTLSLHHHCCLTSSAPRAPKTWHAGQPSCERLREATDSAFDSQKPGQGAPCEQLPSTPLRSSLVSASGNQPLVA